MKFFRFPWNKTALCNSQHCTKLHNEVHISIYWKIGLFCVLVLLNMRKKNLDPQLSIQALSREIRDSTNLVNTNHFCCTFVALFVAFFVVLFVALFVALSVCTFFLKFFCISPWSFVSKYSTKCYILKCISSMWSKEPLSDLRVYRVQQVLNGPTDHYTLAGIMSAWLRKYFRILTHLTPIPHFYTSWKRQKIFFWPDKATWYVLYEQLFWRTSANEYFYLTFSGSIETEHWREWVSNASIPNPGTCFNVLKSSHRRCPIKKSCS